MDQRELETQTKKFLAAYEAKDLATVSEQFSEDVVVRDWNIEIVGKVNALKTFAKNFEDATSLSIELAQLHTSANSVAAEIEITVNSSEVLRVVDVLTFTEDGLIASIVSYKGL